MITYITFMYIVKPMEPLAKLLEIGAGDEAI